MRHLERSERLGLCFVAAVVLVGGVAPVLNPGSLLAAVTYDIAALLTAAVALVGALRLPRGRRSEWLLVAAGCLFFFLGDVTWDFYERVLDEPPLLPSFADALYLLAYPPLIVAVLRLVRRRTDADQLSAWLDVGVLAMAVGLLVWEPLLADSDRGLLGSLIAGAYPVFDIMLLGLAGALVRNRRTALSALLLLGGASTLFVADLVYLVEESRGIYATGGWPDPMYLISIFLLACAPWFDDPVEADDPAGRRREQPVARTAIVVAALAALPIDFAFVAETSASRSDQIVRNVLRVLLLGFVALRLVRQAARHERLLVDLGRTSTRLRTVIENTADAVVFVGPTGEILEWNATAETLFDFTREQVLGTNVLDLLEAPRNIQALTGIMDTLPPGGALEITLDIEARGRPTAIALQIVAVSDADGSLLGYVTLARDVTRRKLASHALQSFSQLQPADALTQFANELKQYVPFDTLSLSTVDGDDFRELARVAATGEGGDRTLLPVPDAELLRGPLLGPISEVRDESYLLLGRRDYGKYGDDIALAGVAESIVLPLRDPLTGDIRGLLGLGFVRPGSATSVVGDSLAGVAADLSRSVNNMMMYERERQTAERLQELDDLREGFFALVAHEVRSPLGAIVTAASVLRDHGDAMDATAARDLAGGISTSASRLARLAGDLVDASRGGHATFPCTMAPITDLGAVVAAAAASAAADKRDRLHVCVTPGIAMRGDADRLAQVVTNLVTNALKFSPGSVEVELARHDAHAVLRVVDHGPGIPPAHTHRLFQRFTRLPYEGAGTRPSGSGLGLYITRELVLAHGGALHHKATLGGGATFVAHLPVAPRDETP